jgi:hypothetical protein
VAEDLFHHPAVINHREDTHGILADRAAERVHMPDPARNTGNGRMETLRCIRFIIVVIK